MITEEEVARLAIAERKIALLSAVNAGLSAARHPAIASELLRAFDLACPGHNLAQLVVAPQAANDEAANDQHEAA
jgi:hypothetical protein